MPNRRTSGKISLPALDRELGPVAARSVVKHLSRTDQKLIPSIDLLKVGDVILSRYLRPLRSARMISEVQRGHKCPARSCVWTHAMLYAGDLHVVESNKPNKLKTGVQIVPLTMYTATHEFVILRYKDPEFAQRSQNIVRYALLGHSINPRKYDSNAGLAAWKPQFFSRASDYEKRINCSEFVLECFVTGGPFLIDRYVEVQADPGKFFFPAHLHAHPGFERIPMKYTRLET